MLNFIVKSVSISFIIS